MWKALGPKRCLEGCRALLADAVQILVRSWKTRTLVPLSMCANMALVALPGGVAEAAEALTGLEPVGNVGNQSQAGEDQGELRRDPSFRIPEY